jgi:Family of unknown function (DUF6445)
VRDRSGAPHGAQAGGGARGLSAQPVFNSRPTLSQLPIGDGAVCVVIDDALEDPQALVELSMCHRGAFTRAEANAFPGLELPLPDSVIERFSESFAQHARSAVGARRVLRASGRLSMVTLLPSQLAPVQRVCHRDRLGIAPDECVGAGVLYLFHDAALGGTSFFRPRLEAGDIEARMRHWSQIDNATFDRETGWPPAYMTQSNATFELTAAVSARWNRLIFYDGSRFHTSQIEQPQLLSDDPARGRLTINLFFVCRRRAE